MTISNQPNIILSNDDIQKLSELFNKSNFIMIKNAYDAISYVEAWDFLQKRNIEESFSMCDDPILYKIMNAMVELGYTRHSNTTFCLVMRRMEYLAIHGKEKFISFFEKSI